MIRWTFIIILCFGLAFAIMNAVLPPPSSQRTGPDFTDAKSNEADPKTSAPSQNSKNESAHADPKIIDWRLLRELDLKTGKRTSELEQINGKPISIPGFMVPFEDNMGEASEFLLVPSPQACIHVPPPPPNQMIFVKMKSKPAKMQWTPIWLSGTFHIQSNDSPYGQVSYYVEGDFTKPFGGSN